MNPKVSVITPTKNRLKLLCEAMDSVQAQTFPDWEHIIVDDGSTDGTAEEVQRRAQSDPRIRYFQRNGERSGANPCRNLGIRKSDAEYIVFLDSDDLLEPGCLGRRSSVMDHNLDLEFAVFPGDVFVDDVGDRGQLFSAVSLGSDLDRVLYLDHPWSISGPIWRKETLTRIGLLSEELPSWQDVELNIRALTAGLKYLKYDTPDHHIRWQFESTKTSVRQFRSPDHLRIGMAIIEGFQARLSDAGLMNWSRRRALAGLVFLLAERWVRNRELPIGLKTWSYAHQANFTPTLLHYMGILVLIVHRLGLFKPPYDERFLERFREFARFRE
jgi:glycosyltransferase involved in cell wall biosynthesis